jgi:type II secretory pathway pseudopilin PulG
VGRAARGGASGASLIEVLVAIAIFASALASLAHLLAQATRTNASARSSTFAATLAEQKVEQLRALCFGFDALGLPVTDLGSDTTASDATPTCAAADGGTGTGLSASPAGTLLHATEGYVDYIDAKGCGLGGGTRPPSSAVYARRWSIEKLPEDPEHSLVLQVMVTPHWDRAGAATRLPGEAWLVAVRARSMR